jgi:hypothetical protein
MLTQSKLNQLGEFYKKDLESRGRKFNDIKFVIKKRKSTGNFGKAFMSYNTKGYDVIEINQYLVNEDEQINTILHELAHLDKEAYGHGHGPSWKRVAALYSRWYNTSITRTSCKELVIPGSIKINIVWSDKCLKLNPHLQKNWSRVVTSMNRASSFVNKYKTYDFIESYGFEKAS